MKKLPPRPAMGAPNDSNLRPMRAIRILALALSLTLVAGACSSSSDAPVAEASTSTAPVETTSAAGQTPDEGVDSTSDDTGSESASTFESSDCLAMTSEVLIEQVWENDETVECGYVTVPADWADADGPTIKIATYRIPSTATSPAPDPVVYLEGGPGGSGSLSVGEFANGGSSYLRARADVIVIDQRGTGYSIPALYCPENGHDGTAEVGHQECHDRWAGEGVDFNDYNSVNNARDVDAVREALGYEEWNLYGVSYGTRLALTVMRDIDSGIRSVVLDSVFPLQVNGLSEAPYSFYWAIDQIAENCVTDPDCDLDAKTLIEDGIERLANSPAGDLDATKYVEKLSGSIAKPELMSLIVAVASGTDEEIAQAGAAVTEDEDDLPEWADVEPSLYPVLGEAIAMGYPVICAEEEPYKDITASPVVDDTFRATTRDTIDNFPEPFNSSLCSIWDVEAGGEVETEPVTSDIPALILAGAADAITPPTWSELTGDTLANSTYVEFPGLTHGLVGTASNDCVNTVTMAFLEEPSKPVDQSCLEDVAAVDYNPTG